MSAIRSLVGILLLCLLSPTSLQAPAHAQPAGAARRLISAEEGEAIVQTAWELRRGLVPKPDCSRFVHDVYTKAGFSYEFAPSRAVFTGIDHFRRVRKPQPGDLVVWQGHIGILIDPQEHTFYSSVLSGFAIENYQSNYWLKRGNPRFYRFVVTDSQRSPLPLLSGTRDLSASGPVLLKLKESFPVSNQAPNQAQAQRLMVANPPASSRPGPARIAAKASAQIAAKAETGHTAGRDVDVHDEVLVTSRATPSRREVLAAVVRSADGNGARLLQDRQLDSQPSVGVVDCFRIVALNLQGNSGLADLEVKQIAAFHYGNISPNQLITKRRVLLSRQEQGWVLLMPQDLVYLNRHLAAVALTNQLAAMSQTPADQPRVKKATRILHDLLSEKGAGASAAGSSD